MAARDRYALLKFTLTKSKLFVRVELLLELTHVILPPANDIGKLLHDHSAIVSKEAILDTPLTKLIALLTQ